MNEKHTQGRLQVVNHYSDEVSIIDSRGFEIVEVPNMPILLGYQEKLGISHWADRPGEAFLELEPEDQAAIARRIVACWNACAGIDTQHLESYGLPDFAQKISDLAAQRDQLLKALESIDTRLRECAKHPISAAEAYDSFYQEEISTAIAACQPAPAVVHLPSDDTEGGAA